ncbi:MAG: DNA adenine methylase [Opitutaceae bacterium]|jgi:DNA adenine methylase|nr:DNA adenine methylase [Opitutaceae bacterium]
MKPRKQAIIDLPPLQHTRDVPRAALRYFGGKWQLAPWIIGHMPLHRVYIEPFGGGASVLLRKPRSKVEVYNDADEEIVGIFRILQDRCACRELFKRLHRTPYARREFDLAFQVSADPVIRAQRAIVRSYLSFHHGALFNPQKTTFANARHRKGSGCKAREWMGYPRVLAAVCRRLRGVVIECGDALDVIRVQDTPDALFFIDPPYVKSTRGSVGYRHEMSDDEHVALLTQLRAIKGRAMVCGYASALYDDLLRDWQRLEHRHYAAAGAGARPRTEVLWISPDK